MVAGLITREPRLLTSSLYADPERVRTLKVSTRSFLRVSCQLVDGWISISPWVSKGILGLGGGGYVDKVNGFFFYYHKGTIRCRIYLDSFCRSFACSRYPFDLSL